MAGNCYGTIFKLTTFGESHGDALGGIIDGCPPGIILDFDAIQKEMERRNQVSLLLLHNEKKQMKSNFFRGFLKVKLQARPLVF